MDHSSVLPLTVANEWRNTIEFVLQARNPNTVKATDAAMSSFRTYCMSAGLVHTVCREHIAMWLHHLAARPLRFNTISAYARRVCYLSHQPDILRDPLIKGVLLAAAKATATLPSRAKH